MNSNIKNTNYKSIPKGGDFHAKNAHQVHCNVTLASASSLFPPPHFFPKPEKMKSNDEKAMWLGPVPAHLPLATLEKDKKDPLCCGGSACPLSFHLKLPSFSGIIIPYFHTHQ